MSIRCFIAIEIDETIHAQMAKLQARFRKQLGPDAGAVKWVEPKLIHLTLKFLGEQADADIPDICTAVDCAVEGMAPFNIDVGGTGTFPAHKAARVLWVGLTQPSEALEQLQAALDRELSEIGFAPETRRFTAHMTLARIRQPAMGHQVRQLAQAVEPFILGTQNVTAVTAFQSDLTRNGPFYTPLHHAPLA